MAGLSLNNQVITEARRWEGTPYKHQHSTFQQGCDCLGLVRGVWRKVVGDEPLKAPNYSPSWDEVAKKEVLLNTAKLLFREVDTPRPGNVLVFRMKRGMVAKHCAIMTAPDRMIHSYNNLGVQECSIVPWWKSKLVFSGAFPGGQ